MSTVMSADDAAMPQASPGWAPTRKVESGLVAGALTTIVVWGLRTFTGVEPTAEVASALTVLLGTLTAYMVKDAGR